MKLETALLRLIGEPEKVIRRLSWDASRPSIGIKANLSQVAPSMDDTRWNSLLYSKSKTGRLTKVDLNVHDMAG